MKKTLIYFVLILSAVLWGASYVMTKELFLTEPDITVPIIITFRLLSVVVVFMPLLLLTHKLQKIQKGDLKWFLILACIEPFSHNMLETGGVQLVSSSLSSIIIATCPVFIPFAMAAIYKEGLKANHILGVVLSVVGISIMLIGGDSAIDGSAKGILLLAGAVAMSVAYTLLISKIVGKYEPITVTMYQNAFGFLFYLPVIALTSASKLPLLSWSPKMILLIAGLGIFCSMLAYACYNYGVQKVGATKASVFVNGIPVVTMIVAVLIGQETLSIWKALGMFVVIFGIVLAQKSPKLHTTKES